MRQKNKLNILYVHDARFVSGLERALLNIFKALDRTRFIPFFLGSKWSDGHFIKLAEDKGIECRTTNMAFLERTLNPFKLARCLCNYIVATLDIVKFIKDKEIHIIHSNSMQACFYSYLASVFTGKPIVRHEHAIMNPDFFGKLVTRILDKRIRLYIAVSLAVKDRLIRLGVNRNKIRVIYNAVDIERFDASLYKGVSDLKKKFNLPIDSLLIAIIGQLAPYKGQKDFIDAARIVAKKFPKARFLIIGAGNDDQYAHDLKKMAEDSELKGRIIFTDWFENIENIYYDLNMVVFATINEEAFGLVIIEAMAASKPVVATGVGGVPEIVVNGETGLLVPPNNPEEMAEAILKLACDEQLMASFGAAGRKLAEEKFALRKIIGEIEDVYYSMVITHECKKLKSCAGPNIMQRKEKVNILYVYDARFVSGLERALLNMFNALDRARFTPFFLGSKWSDGYFVKLARAAGVECRTTNMAFLERTPNPFRVLRYIFDYLVTVSDLVRFIRDKEIDIIHSNSMPSLFYSALPAVMTNRILLWHEQATMQEDFLKKLTVAVLGRVTRRFIAASESVKIHMQAIGVPSDKIDVIYNGADLERFNYNNIGRGAFRKKFRLENKIVAGIFGQLAPLKGQRDFIEAAKTVCGETDNVRFVIVGMRTGSDYEKELEGLVKKAGLDTKVFFPGWHEDVEEAYCGVDIVVQATVSEEPSSLVLYEAMSCSRPVIATSVGGNKEIIEDGATGMLIPPERPDRMAKAILMLASDEGLRMSFGLAGRKLVEEKFSMPKIVKEIENIYYSELDKNGTALTSPGRK